jgi:hypothetical protein
LSQATGDLIFLSAGDDYSSINRVEVSVNFFLKNKIINIACSSYVVIDELGNLGKCVLRDGVYIDPAALIRKGAAYSPQGMVFRADFYKELAKIDDQLPNEDDFLGMAGMLRGGVGFIPEALYFYRIHSNSVSGWSLLEKNNDEYIKRYFQDQKIRTLNYLAWKSLIQSCEIEHKPDLLRLIDSRICLSRVYEELPRKKILIRLTTLFTLC